MAALVTKALLIGPWKNVEEVEEALSLPEIIALLKEDAEQEFSRRKFMAALKGITLDDPAEDKAATFEEVKRRAAVKRAAQRSGLTEEQVELMDIGIDYEG